MKKIVLILSCLLLVACGSQKEKSSKTETSASSSSSQTSTAKKELKFVTASKYEGQTSDLIELGKT